MQSLPAPTAGQASSPNQFGHLTLQDLGDPPKFAFGWCHTVRFDGGEQRTAQSAPVSESTLDRESGLLSPGADDATDCQGWRPSPVKLHVVASGCVNGNAHCSELMFDWQVGRALCLR